MIKNNSMKWYCPKSHEQSSTYILSPIHFFTKEKTMLETSLMGLKMLVLVLPDQSSAFSQGMSCLGES